MSNIIIRPQGVANFYALLQGDQFLGEVQGNGEFTESDHLNMAAFAVNLLNGQFPIAPQGAKWEPTDCPNCLLLVQYSNNKPNWLVVLSTDEVVAIPQGDSHAN